MTDETAVAVIEQPKLRSVLVDMSDRYGMEPQPFEATLRATVVKGNVSREEFAAFLLVAKEYNLNPLTKEIYAFPAKGGGIVPIVSIDGWCRIINEHKACDGIEFVDQREGTTLVAITCRIYRKDRSHPTEVTEYMEECRGGGDVWKRWPNRMLRHKSLIQAARYAFGFSGIYDEDEYDRMEQARDVTPQSSGLMQRLKGEQEGDGFNADEVKAQTEKPKRKTKAEKQAAETPADPEPVDAEISEISEFDTSHAAPGEVYLHSMDSVETAEGRIVTFKDGARWSAVKPEKTPDLHMYAVHAPEIVEPADDIPEHMRDDVAPASVEEAQEEFEPNANGPDELTGIGKTARPVDRPTSAEASTETETAPPAEPEPDTSEPVTPASSDGPETSDSGPSAEAEKSLPDDLQAYGEAIETAGDWSAALDVMRPFFSGAFFKGLDEKTQNKIRGRTWANLVDLKNFRMPDPGENLTAFRLFIEFSTDAEAISGTFQYLKNTGDSAWSTRPIEVREQMEKAVALRLKELGNA